MTSAEFDRFEEDCDLALPISVRQFYSDVGNGLQFRRFIDQANALLPCCWLKVPQLTELKLAIDYLNMLNGCLADHYFDEAQDPAFAQTQYTRQLSFFPILPDNADLLCIENRQTNNAVVFHDHEWSSYARGVSGLVLANSLRDFWYGWAEVGFVAPKNNWWPDWIGGRGTEWTMERFGFCLTKDEQ